jgi:hypothetical protein
MVGEPGFQRRLATAEELGYQKESVFRKESV